MVLLSYNNNVSSPTVETHSRKNDDQSITTGILHLFDILQYATQCQESPNSYHYLPTMNLKDPCGIPFPISAVDVCFRCRPNTSPSQAFKGTLIPLITLDPVATTQRSLKSPSGLLWIESQNSIRSPHTRYRSAIRSGDPPPWTVKLKSGSLQQQSAPPTIASTHRSLSPIETVKQLQSESHNEMQSSHPIQRPSTPLKLNQFPLSSPPHLTSSSALPFPQLIGGQSTVNASSISYDPISLTLSLFGFGGSTLQGSTESTSRLGLMEETDPNEVPLFIRSNTLLDRQRFIIGLRELRYMIAQVNSI